MSSILEDFLTLSQNFKSFFSTLSQISKRNFQIVTDFKIIFDIVTGFKNY